jgi:hypothetical protein
LEAFNFRYNISFIDPPLGGFGEILPSGQSPEGNIITEGNISPNPPSGGSINDNSTWAHFVDAVNANIRLFFAFLAVLFRHFNKVYSAGWTPVFLVHEKSIFKKMFKRK